MSKKPVLRTTHTPTFQWLWFILNDNSAHFNVFHLRLLTTTNANLKQFTLIWSTCRKTPIYCFEVSSRLIEFNQVCFILYVLLFSIITNYFIFQGEHLEVKCTVYWQLTVKHISIQSDHKWNLKNIPKGFYKICTWFVKLFNEI